MCLPCSGHLAWKKSQMLISLKSSCSYLCCQLHNITFPCYCIQKKDFSVFFFLFIKRVLKTLRHLNVNIDFLSLISHCTIYCFIRSTEGLFVYRKGDCQIPENKRYFQLKKKMPVCIYIFKLAFGKVVRNKSSLIFCFFLNAAVILLDRIFAGPFQCSRFSKSEKPICYP
jgi:hypothetical protein